MKINIEKSTGRSKCRYPTCSKNPEFITDKGRIKSGTLCAVLGFDTAKGYSLI